MPVLMGPVLMTGVGDVCSLTQIEICGPIYYLVTTSINSKFGEVLALVSSHAAKVKFS